MTSSSFVLEPIPQLPRDNIENMSGVYVGFTAYSTVMVQDVLLLVVMHGFYILVE